MSNNVKEGVGASLPRNLANRVTADHITQYEVTINRSAKDVWPHLLNQDTWMKHFQIDRVSGDPGTEGEIKIVFMRGGSSEESAKARPMFFKTLRLEPYKKFVYRPFTGKDYSVCQYSFTGTAILTLNEIDSKTCVKFNLYLETESMSMTQKEMDDRNQAGIDRAKKAWANNFIVLKELVEKSC